MNTRNIILSLFIVDEDHTGRAAELVGINWAANDWAFGDRAEVASEWLGAEAYDLLGYEFDGYEYTATLSPELQRELERLAGEQE